MPGSSSAEAECALSDGGMSEEEIKSLASDYAAISIRLSHIPCDMIGSVVKYEQGSATWGPLINGGYAESFEAPYFGGPFYTLRDRYVHRINSLISLFRRGLIHRMSPLVHYLALMEARRLVMGDAKMAERESVFYIRHPDCSGSNILSDGPKIVGLIDWGW
jgi:hypothetical protein